MKRLSQLVSHFRTDPLRESKRAFCQAQEESCVLIERKAGNYVLTLNRPKALNSLDIPMVNVMTPFYQKLVDAKKPCV